MSVFIPFQVFWVHFKIEIVQVKICENVNYHKKPEYEYQDYINGSNNIYKGFVIDLLWK